MTTIASTAAAAATNAASKLTGFAALGVGDFVKLMTTELKNQDPTNPTDNKDMLAQLAQFTSLSAANSSKDTLKEISAKLDVLISTQAAAIEAAANLAAASQAATSQTA